MEFRILGPLEIAGDDAAGVTIGGGRERALLALLLLSANRVVPAERLAVDLWGDRPPEDPAHALRIHISRLRKVLREAGAEGIVVTQPPGYVLTVDPDAVDALRFESLAARGREQAAGGDQEQAAATLWEAMGLWRGPALADVADAPLARAEAARLEEARLAALEDRVEADLGCGRHGQLVAELDALTRAHPLRERLWAQRMTALYRAGRQAEALRAYQEVRAILGEELGLEPGGTLQRLEGAILRHEPELDWHGPGTRSALVERGAAMTAPPPDHLPVLLRRLVESSPFTGRAAELAELRRAWEGAANGSRHVVFVVGEAGIGKTRLAGQLAAEVRAGGGTVLFGRCDEEALTPYQPFAEALERLVAVAPPGLLDAFLRESSGELSRVLPRLSARREGPAMPSLQDQRYPVFEAVDELLTRAWAAGPVLLILDDLHWADRPTLLLVKHLARHADRSGLLLVGTYRVDDVSRGHALTDVLIELRRHHGFERIVLKGLTVDDVDALIRSDPGWTGAAPLAAALCRATEGNPFFVRELLGHLDEIGALERVRTDARPDRVIQELGVPEGILELVGRRLTHLEPAAHRVLAMASVIGQGFPLDLLVRITGSGEDQVLDSLEAALRAALIEETPAQVDRYRFRHALIREVLYREIPTSRRVRLHRQIGEAMEAGEEGHLSELAYHFHAAGPGGDPERGVAYAERAAKEALAQLAYEPAASFYGLALEALGWAPAEDASRRAELLLGQGDACRRAGETARARTAYLGTFEIARQLPDPVLVARAALGLGEASAVWGADTALIEALELALSRIDTNHAGLRARVLARLAQALCHDADQRRPSQELIREAVETARRSRDAAALAAVLDAGHAALSGPDGLAERLEIAGELLRLADELEDQELALLAHGWRVVNLLEAGDLAGMDQARAEHARLAAAIRQPLHQRDAIAWEAMRAMLDGRFDDAANEAERARSLSESAGDPYARASYHAQRFRLALEIGSPEALEKMADSIRDIVASQGPSWLIYQSSLALIYARLDRKEAAGAELQTILSSGAFADAPRDLVWLDVMTNLAEVCAFVDDSDTACRLLPSLAPYADRFVVKDRAMACNGSVSRFLGLLASTAGRPDEAVRYLEAALAVHQSLPAPPLVARTRCDLAHLLSAHREQPQAAAATEHARLALALADSLGMTTLADRCRPIADIAQPGSGKTGVP
ncbi:MAG: AAA family ATPase [Actinobacteria bacterium]|nr:AAA family ATPase [Actinomycetota bacterium]